MKTTVVLPDALVHEAQEIARRDRTTLRDLIETGLRMELRERTNEPDFVLRDASVNGDGLQPEFRDYRWEQVRDAIYGDRG